MKSHLQLTVVAALVILPLGSALAAQSASSKNHFIVSAELASGGVGNSSKFKMHAVVGGGVVPSRLKSTKFVVAGGYAATLDVSSTGRPWLAGVMPRFATPKSGATLTLLGTELNRGPAPTVKVGGVTATVLTRAQDQITVRMPVQPAPGWQHVSVSTGSSPSTVVQGIGILPMMLTEPAPAPNVAFDIVFKGSPGDQVVWALSPFSGPPVKLPGFLYGLALNPVALILMPSFRISSPSGELRLPIPASPYVGTAFGQAVFSTSNSGYGPVSFSNVFRF